MKVIIRTTVVIGAAIGAAICSLHAGAADIIINEGNAVGSEKWLDNPDPNAQCPMPEGPAGENCAEEEDVYHGRVMGNGGDWIELFVVGDHVDIRGWEIRWAETDNAPGEADTANGTDIWIGNGNIEQGIITFTDDPLWSDLRSGTIITITERTTAEGGLDTDVSFDPCSGDWWINVNSFDTQYITTVTNVLANPNAMPGDPDFGVAEEPGHLSVGNDEWQGRIVTDAGALHFGPIGEATPTWNGSGVNSREVFRLEEDPSTSIDETSFIDDADSSSFGHVNRWSQFFSVPGIGFVECGLVQNAAPLRAWAEADCDCPQVVLNEYNAVATDMWLNGGDMAMDEDGGVAASDSFFGRVIANGGNWIELVVIEDGVDMRNWTIDWEEIDDFKSGTITLSNDPFWSNLPSGAIITIIEWNTAQGGLDTDTSLSLPGDRWANINSFDTQYIAGTTTTEVGDVSGNFSVGNSDWYLTIRNSGGNIVFGPVGEGQTTYTGRGVGNTEVCALQNDPTGAINPASFFTESIMSTFGAPNSWRICQTSMVMSQSFAGLPDGSCTFSVPGDATNDGSVDVFDVLAVLGEWGACDQPCPPYCLEDVNEDCQVDVFDLLMVLSNWTG